MGKVVFALIALLALGPKQETDCSGGPGPCIAAVISGGGIGLQGISNGGSSGAGVNAQRNGPGAGVAAVGNPAYAANASSGGTLLYQGSGAKGPVFHIDVRGNAVFAGKVIAAHETQQLTANGERVATYAGQTTSPVLEDFGETQLVAGRAYVRLDPQFAAAIANARYLVFLTPQSPSAGTLSVAAKSWVGFVVRDTTAERAEVAYRIVAQPYGSTAPRLPSLADRP